MQFLKITLLNNGIYEVENVHSCQWVMFCLCVCVFGFGAFFHGLQPTVGWELALVQKQSNLLGHTCSPRLFSSVKLQDWCHFTWSCEFFNYSRFPLAVTWTKCGSIYRFYLLETKEKCCGGWGAKEKIPKSFILFILVLLLVCSCHWQKKIKCISFSKGLSVSRDGIS